MPSVGGAASAADLSFVMKAHVAVSYGVAASKWAETCREGAMRTIGREFAVQDAQLETGGVRRLPS